MLHRLIIIIIKECIKKVKNIIIIGSSSRDLKVTYAIYQLC